MPGNFVQSAHPHLLQDLMYVSRLVRQFCRDIPIVQEKGGEELWMYGGAQQSWQNAMKSAGTLYVCLLSIYLHRMSSFWCAR